MPKSHVLGGPTYAGHVDVGSPDIVTPDWQPTADVAAEAVAPEPVVEPEAPTAPSPRRRTRGA